MDGDVFSLFLQSLVDYPARTQSWPMSRLGDLYCCCIALHWKTLHCIGLHCIISKHILGAFIEAALTEKRCHATRWNTALSLPLLWWAAVGHGWPVSGGSCILCLRRFTIESKCWKKHIYWTWMSRRWNTSESVDDATSAVVWDVGMGTLGSLICNLESKLWEDCSWEFYKV